MIKKIQFIAIGKLAISIVLFLQCTCLLSQQSISAIKLLPLGSVVTTTGIITTGPEFGQIRYMQDAEAGIAIYSKTMSSRNAGDSILITGVLSSYQGQLQLSPVMSHSLISTGHTMPQPVEIDLNNEENPDVESMRAILPCVGIVSCEQVFESGWYNIFDSHGSSSKMVVFQEHPIVGNNIPEGPVIAVGIWTVNNHQYKLLGQSIADASEGNCRVIGPGKLTYKYGKPVLVWENVVEEISWIEFGSPAYGQTDTVTILDNQIEYAFESLSNGNIYQARLCQLLNGVDTIYSYPAFLSAANTSFPPIDVFFNRQINSSFSDGSEPDGVGASVIESDVIARIDQVNSTLDIAMYNSSRDRITQAVSRAVQRGVMVRYLADDETSNTALEGTLNFPVLFRSGDGLMHNKFIIADADDPLNAWVWTGSTNFSSNQLSTDPNHAFVLHDQALARNYRHEFDEFWGTIPNHKNGKYGESKSDNTSHLFQLGNVKVESYFSPSDETNCHILEALRTTNHHLEIGLLLLTKEDLVDELIDFHQHGIDIRLIVEDEEGSSLALSRLRQAGIKTATHDFANIFHHKYAIIDEGYLDSDPQVITGSHNWTWSADNINDENTLIIHDQSFTNIFRQEFEARWGELVQSSTINAVSSSGVILQPNPASDHFTISNPKAQRCTITLIDVNGCIMTKYKLEGEQALDIPIDQLMPNGVYILHSKWNQDFSISKLVIQR